MVDDPATADIVGWSASGNELVIRDDERFAQQVLPDNFKHNNLSSFVRQLNTYGFSKVDSDRMTFAHLHFRRDAPEQINLIQRKSSHKSAPRAGAAAPGAGAVVVKSVADDLGLPGPSEQPMALFAGAEADTPQQEEEMRAELREIQRSHSSMEGRIKELNSQLQQTKAQQANTRESVHKIMAFLSQVWHSANGGDGSAAGGTNLGVDARALLRDAPDMPAPPVPAGSKRKRITDAQETLLVDGLQKPAEGSVSLEERVEEEAADVSFPPILPTRQPSLGEQAASALPDDLQDVAFSLMGSPELQDAVLQRVQSDQPALQRLPSDHISGDDVMAYLWDFLEANQDNVEQRETSAAAAAPPPPPAAAAPAPAAAPSAAAAEPLAAAPAS